MSNIKEVVIGIRHPIDDDYDLAAMFPGIQPHDTWWKFIVDSDNNILELCSGPSNYNPKPSTPIIWHKIDISAIDNRLLLFILQSSVHPDFPYTDEILQYALENDYIWQPYYEYVKSEDYQIDRQNILSKKS